MIKFCLGDVGLSISDSILACCLSFWRTAPCDFLWGLSSLTRIEPRSRQWKSQVLMTGLPGNSLLSCFLNNSNTEMELGGSKAAELPRFPLF